jgi:ADP-ribose pyrophosphatase YjhB (NUDIX family)
MIRSGLRAVTVLVLLALVGCGQQAGSGPAEIGDPTGAPTPMATVAVSPAATSTTSTAAPTAAPTLISPREPAVGPTAAATGTASAVATPTAESDAAPGEEADVGTPDEERALEAARRTLAEQTGVPADEVRLVSIAETEWPDASLGCPRPGMMYAQVITPGYLVTLEAEGRTHEVHTDRNGRAVICKDGASADRADDEVVRVTRSGGLAGLTTTMRVAADGSVRFELEGDERGALAHGLTPEDVTRIRTLVNSPQWQALEDQYGEPVPDAFAYTIEAEGKRVTTYDGAQSPPLMRRLLAELAPYWASE